jgi:hypothetical protein
MDIAFTQHDMSRKGSIKEPKIMEFVHMAKLMEYIAMEDLKKYTKSSTMVANLLNLSYSSVICLIQVL